jgi:hypothetical protein
MIRLVLPGLEDGLTGSTWSGGWSGWYLVLSALLHQSVKKIPPSMKQFEIKTHSSLVWLMFIFEISTICIFILNIPVLHKVLTYARLFLHAPGLLTSNNDIKIKM